MSTQFGIFGATTVVMGDHAAYLKLMNPDDHAEATIYAPVNCSQAERDAFWDGLTVALFAARAQRWPSQHPIEGPQRPQISYALGFLAGTVAEDQCAESAGEA